MKRILIFSDNRAIYNGMQTFVEGQSFAADVDYASSPGTDFAPNLRIRDCADDLVERYRLIVSGHCKQIFPAELVRRVRCVNLHPGFNPETRGWYPQVFAILRGLKVGLTVHVMDEQIDHGPVIYREEVEARFWDTSKSLYDRVVEREIASIPLWLPLLVDDTAQTFPAEGEGQYHSRADFNELCELDLSTVGSFLSFYNHLRATSHPPHKNLYVRDPESGRRIFLRLELEPEQAGPKLEHSN